MLTTNLTGRLPATTIGLLIYFVPFFSYLTPSNLTQLSGYDVFEIFIALTFILILVFIVAISLENLFKHLFKKNIILFPFICFAFYLNFLYIPFFELLQEFLFLKYNYRGPIGILVFIVIEFICLGIIMLGARYNNFSLRLILIFSTLMIIKSLIPLASYIAERLERPTIITNEFKNDLIAKEQVQLKRNVYYIILDSMLDLGVIEPFNIVTKKEVVDKLSNSFLRYIDKSQSSYSETNFSITSLMLLDYHKRPNSPRYTDSSTLFPKMMYDNKVEIPLLSYLEKINSTFYWAAGENYDCVPTARWTCINSHQNFLKSDFFMTSSNLWNFSLSTPFPKFFKRLFKSDRSQDTITPFLEFIEKNGIPQKPFLAYIHHNIPHHPYHVSSQCEKKDYHNQTFEGYQASYKCALNMIELFMQKINIMDPEAIVVFQGDHGLPLRDGSRDYLNLDLSDDVKHLFSGGIFNAIKAPEACFKKYGLPKTTVNTIRFAMNCAYGYKFPYRKNIHYYSENLGKVVERKLY